MENDVLVRPLNLDSRIRIRWFFRWAIILFPLLAAIFFGVYVLLPEYGFAFATHYETLFLFFTILLIISLVLTDELNYRRYTYLLMPNELIIEKGIVEKIRYIVPYEKMQNVTVSRDIMDRILGLCTLHIDTAGHDGQGSSIIIPGISENLQLDKKIRELSKAAREHRTEGDGELSEKALLKAILQEIAEIRHALASSPETQKGVMLERLRGRKG